LLKKEPLNDPFLPATVVDTTAEASWLYYPQEAMQSTGRAIGRVPYVGAPFRGLADAQQYLRDSWLGQVAGKTSTFVPGLAQADAALGLVTGGAMGPQIREIKEKGNTFRVTVYALARPPLSTAIVAPFALGAASTGPTKNTEIYQAGIKEQKLKAGDEAMLIAAVIAHEVGHHNIGGFVHSENENGEAGQFVDSPHTPAFTRGNKKASFSPAAAELFVKQLGF
jgi:hypothetical protein